MKKVLLSLAVFGLLAVAGSASAAVSFQDFGMTVNGTQTDDVRAGSTYKLGFALDVDSGDEVEYVQVRHIDENGDIAQIPQCFAITPRLVNVDDKQVILTVKTASDLPDGPYDVLLRTFGVAGLSTDIPHTPVDFHAYVTPYSCIDGWPRSFRRLLCSSVRFNPSGHCPETLSRCIPTPEWKTHRAVGCCTGLPC